MLPIIKKIIYFIFIFFIGLFIASSFFLRAKYNYYIYGDNPILQKQRLGDFVFGIIIMVILSFVLYKVSLKLNRYRKEIVIPLILLGAFIIQLAFVFAFTRLPTDDSLMVLSIAMNMLYNKDYSSFNFGGYLYMFPFNYSTVLYLKGLLFLFPDNYLTLKIFNIFFTLITTLMAYLIFQELNYKKKENDYGVLIFGATYIPSICMNNFIYNDVVSTTFFISAIYYTIKFVKLKSLKYIVIASALLSIGNYLRRLGLIILVAVVMYVILNVKKTGFKKTIISFCIILLAFNTPSWTQSTILKTAGIVSESDGDNSAPVYMWLNMGINPQRLGFWDQLESYYIYQVEGKYNKERSSELFIAEIKTKFLNMTKADILKMYYKKLIWTWTEGTYQVDRYGIGVTASYDRRGTRLLGGYCYNNIATDLLKEDSSIRSYLLFMLYITNFLMYCFILVRTIKSIRDRNFEELLLVLVILGFIAFYLLWEIKSRYIYPVYPILIVLSYMGLKDVFSHQRKLLS